MTRSRAAILAGALVVLGLFAWPGNAQAAVIDRVSVSSTEAQGDYSSTSPSISADSRYVAFFSAADNLAPGDTNGVADVFVRDRLTGTTERVSVDSAGIEGNGGSYAPCISADGGSVAFVSDADNLVPGDTNGVGDVFVHDRETGITERASLSTASVQGNDWTWDCALSGDGRYVAFQSTAGNLVPGDTNGDDDIFVRDMQAGTTERVSVHSGGAQANGSSYEPSISADGRYVAFGSDASNLVPADANSRRDAFVRDRQAGTTSLVSVSGGEIQGNLSSGARSISANGRYVAFLSYATNLVTRDTNGVEDVFVRDLLNGTTVRVNVSGSGAQANGLTSLGSSLSADGRYVAFDSMASNLVPGDTNGFEDVFVAEIAPAGGFIDIGSSPYKVAIEEVARRGVVAGYGDGTFGPTDSVLRKQFAKMIVGAVGLAASEEDWQGSDPPFLDCGADNLASPYPHDFIAVAKAHGLTKGKTASTFEPDAKITRAEIATMVVRAAHSFGIDLEPVGAGYSGVFWGYADPTHGGNVHLADHNGLLDGLQVTGTPSLWMAGYATRGQVAQILWNLMQMIADTD